MEDINNMASAEDIEKNKVWGILAYFIFFLPLITARDSKFAMFHANQSLVLLLVSIISSIIAGFVPVIGWVIGLFIPIIVFIVWLMGIIAAAGGKMKKLPLIGGITILK